MMIYKQVIMTWPKSLYYTCVYAGSSILGYFELLKQEHSIFKNIILMLRMAVISLTSELC